MMHIDPTMIHPELRRAASLIRFFWPSFTERKFHLAKVANEKLKGKCRSPIAYEQKTITRRDNSQLRLCIYSPLEPKADVPGLLWLHGGGLAVALTLFARDQKEVHMRVFDGCFHGFDIVCAKTGIAQVAKDFLMTHFLYATEHYYAAQPPE